MLDRLVDNTDSINQLNKENKEKDYEIRKLKEMVFHSDEKLDVFEQINLRLAEGEANRKILEERVTSEVEGIKRHTG